MTIPITGLVVNSLAGVTSPSSCRSGSEDLQATVVDSLSFTR